jgi:hypothetical protein
VRTRVSHAQAKAVKEVIAEGEEQAWRVKLTMRSGATFPPKDMYLRFGQLDDTLQEMVRRFANEKDN